MSEHTEHDDLKPDALDRLIADAARDYHTPPAAVPREAMWAAIVAARPAGAPVVPAAPVVSLDAERARRSGWRVQNARNAWRLAAAAAIFLTTGVGIGRWWSGARPNAQAPAAGTQVAANAVPNAAPNTTPNTAPNGVPDPAVDVTSDAATTAVPNVVASVPNATVRAATRSAEPAARPADLYDVALRQHVVKVEALLVSYRADSADVQTDRALAAWARPLLGDTRLLLDSPAAADPRRRRLLEDLELVLAQMARLAPAAAAPSDSSAATNDRNERQFIDGALRRGQLLPRIRTMLPVGTTD